MDSNNYLFLFILALTSFFITKYLNLFLTKISHRILIDDQFTKPQAFHEHPVSTVGGLCVYFSFLLVYFYTFFFKNINYFEYFSFCSLIFFLGFIDDIKIRFNPNIRLLLMIFLLLFLVNFNNFFVEKTGIGFINELLENSKIFSLVFVCICFLFIINGANLIDGYNGLLGIHSLIIITNLFFINYMGEVYDLSYFLFSFIVILLVFLLFNFPKAKIFLGDSGSYFLGSFIAVSAILTSIANPKVSPFYFCIILFYLFFEVFFSFLRKFFVEKKSPIRPDEKHLHMLVYKFFLKRNKNKAKSNYLVSILVNAIYLALIIPAILMKGNGIFCKYYSLFLFIIYLFSYKFVKNDNL